MLRRGVFATCSEEHSCRLPDQSTLRLSGPHDTGSEDPIPCSSHSGSLSIAVQSQSRLTMKFLVDKFRGSRRIPDRTPTRHRFGCRFVARDPRRCGRKARLSTGVRAPCSTRARRCAAPGGAPKSAAFYSTALGNDPDAPSLSTRSLMRACHSSPAAFFHHTHALLSAANS